jgi:hypothetical protein
VKQEDAEQMIGAKLAGCWDVVEVKRAGKRVGFFIVCGNEIHCFRVDDAKGRWITRQDLERLTKPVFKKFGALTTRVRKENEQGHTFVQRLGFVPVGDDAATIHYECKRLKHARL